MATTSSPTAGGSARLPLSMKLAASLLVVAAAMLTFLLVHFGPRTTDAFLDHSEDLISHSSDSMRQMASRDTGQSAAILSDLITHTTDARRRTLSDLPLTIYAGDIERMRAAILARDAARSDQLQSNVAVLTREMKRRALLRVDEHVALLRGEQEALSRSFADDLRRSYMLLSGGVLMALILLLGLGLNLVVIRPIRSLHAATRAVAQGDLSVPLAAAGGLPKLRDEVTDLSADFRGMVQQLRSSRDQIEQKNAQLAEWNERLEAEIDRKSRQLIHAAKMASVGTLAGGIAHEFNNLIGGIRGCVREARQDASPEGQELLDVALRATSRAAEITDQLLSFARQRIGEKCSVALAQVMDEVLRLIDPQARRQGVAIETDYAEHLLVMADASALHQVFLNLATNALQAMPNGGRLSIATAPGADTATVRISDTGCGIDPDDLEHVFEPFFTSRGDAEDPWFRGTGLGLSVSYSIVEAHHGTMTVSSTLGSGTTFSITLPCSADQADTGNTR